MPSNSSLAFSCICRGAFCRSAFAHVRICRGVFVKVHLSWKDLHRCRGPICRRSFVHALLLICIGRSQIRIFQSAFVGGSSEGSVVSVSLQRLNVLYECFVSIVQ